MVATIALLITATLVLAFANGANDNFKGVATLAGCGSCNYRTAIRLATAATFAGSVCATVFATGLVTTFSGKGLVPDSLVADPILMAAVGLGAAATVIIATLTGIPISTTHALVGGLLGAGLVASGGNVAWAKLGSVFLIPLLAGPLLALGLAALVYPPLRRVRRALRVTTETCVCLEGGEFVPATVRPGGVVEIKRGGMPVVVIDDAARCVDRYQGRVLGVSAGALADRIHYLSAVAVSFARGLNDTPKIVAILITTHAAAASLGFNTPYIGFGMVAVAIAVGGLFGARKVARTMSTEITSMNVGQGLTANLVTAVLVIVASRFGMPVSTTHVSCGSLFGIGAVTGQGHWRMIGTIVLAWVTTLPVGALLGAATYYVLH